MGGLTFEVSMDDKSIDLPKLKLWGCVEKVEVGYYNVAVADCDADEFIEWLETIKCAYRMV